MAEFRFIDLFAGIGGLRIPFQGLGGNCVFSSEIDTAAVQTYYTNFGEMPEGDITAIPADDIPEHDLLLAGFPCQPFSIAGVSKNKSLGRKHGFGHATRGTLFFDVARIIEHHKPAAFVLENVKGLKSHDSGRTFEIIRGRLEDELQYNITSRVLDAKNVVPQHRERIFIVGFREDLEIEFEFPEIKSTNMKLGDILETDLPDADIQRFTLSDHLWQYLQDYKEKHSRAGNGFGFGLVGPGDTARTLSARYYKDGSEILIRQKGKNPRKLTHVEARKLMGFPEDFISHPTQSYKQFGNAVVPKIVDTFAPEIVELLKQVVEPQPHEDNVQQNNPTIEALLSIFKSKGVDSVYLKHLSPNDNSKHQIYVGGSLAAASIFPFDEDSIIKQGEGRRQRLKVPISLEWVDLETEQSWKAPNSKLILYPQYPEVRLSGFLQGCKKKPTCLSGPGPEDGRILFLGISDDTVFACVFDSNSGISSREIPAQKNHLRPSSFREIEYSRADEPIREKLRSIINSSPHKPCILKEVNSQKTETPYSIQNNNAAGYTMEAKLGILPNGLAGPDYDGHEVKTLLRTTITLMTPEPKSGYYKEEGISKFLKRYGYPDSKTGEYRLSKRHKINQRHPDTGLTLVIDHKNLHPSENRVDFGGTLSLVEDDGTVAASWELEALLRHWLTKHSSTVIVRAKKNELGIEFLPEVLFCYGPDPSGLIDAFKRGLVYWDPGLKETKKRNQFRINLTDLKKSNLWDKILPVSLN